MPSARLASKYCAREVRWLIFPYGMERNQDGTWSFFNRRYSLLGASPNEHLEFGNLQKGIPFRMTCAKRDLLHWNGKGRLEDRIWFYNDGCLPEASAANLAAYLDRLRILFK